MYITWYTQYAYFISDFYIFCASDPEKALGHEYRPGILVYFYVQLGARVVRNFRARAQIVIFEGAKIVICIKKVTFLKNYKC